MPADRRIPVSPRKDEIYARPSAVEPPQDPPHQPIQLPSFSNLFPYVKTPSPPATPTMYTSPFWVATQLPNTPTHSAVSTRFPASPCSPMSDSTSTCSAMSYSASPRPTLPPISLLFQANRIPIPIHYTGDTSPCKIREPRRLGLPNAGGPTKPRGREVREVPPQILEPVAGGSTLSPGLVKCGWPDCAMAAAPTKRQFWIDHLNHHFATSEKSEDGKAACGWGGCGERIGGKQWVNHVRHHDVRFFTECPVCGRKYVTTRLEAHMAKAHSTAANDGASGENRA